MRKYFWVGFAARKFRKLCRPGHSKGGDDDSNGDDVDDDVSCWDLLDSSIDSRHYHCDGRDGDDSH